MYVLRYVQVRTVVVSVCDASIDYICEYNIDMYIYIYILVYIYIYVCVCVM